MMPMSRFGSSQLYSLGHVDSRACVYGAFCIEDVNADVAVTVVDLLQILGALGQVFSGYMLRSITWIIFQATKE